MDSLDASSAPADSAPPVVAPPPRNAVEGAPSTAPRPASWRLLLASPVAWLIAAGLGLGVFLRVYGFNFPPFFLFDEHHFVENGRNYLAHRADWNDHPPLGKLFIALTIRLLGDGPFGWRTPSLLSGFATLVVGGLAARRLFDDKRAGWLAAMLLACDGFTSAYSRTALLDGHLALASVATLLLATYRSSWPQVVAAGLLTGFAASIKFSGGAVAIPLLVALSLSGLRPAAKAQRVLVAGALAIAFYLSQFMLGLSVAGQHGTPALAISETFRLLQSHAGATEMKNPWVSGWPTWALPLRALVIGYTDNGRYLRVLSGLGNLAIWWSAVGVGLAAFALVLRRGLTATLGADAGTLADAASLAAARVSELTSSAVTPPSASPAALSAFVRAQGRGVVLVLSGVVAFLAPWVLTHRDSYIYHFLPCYAALLVLLAGFANWVGRRSPRLLLGWLVVVLLVSIIYTPVWSFLPISQEGFRARLFLPTWR